MSDSVINPSTADAKESSDTVGTLKRSRRQAAFYPNTQNIPSNPFSKSAAKRESVMALGSIEHLQHYFTKTGLASKRKTTNIKGLVPALGPSVVPTLEISGISPSGVPFELPPSPVVQTVSRAPYPQVDRVYPQTDPEALKPGLIRDLEETERAWSVGVDSNKDKDETRQGPQLLTASNVKKQAETSFEVLEVLKTTTKTIRSVRNYLISLPDDHRPAVSTSAKPQEQQSTGGTPSGILRQPGTPGSRYSTLPPTATFSNSSSNAVPAVPFPSADPHTRIRKAALEVLAMLRLLEESNRIPLSDDAYDSLSVGSANGDVPLSVSDEYVTSSGARTPPRSNGSAGRQSGVFSAAEEDDNESATSAGGSSASRRASSFRMSKQGITTAFVPLKGGGATVQVWVDEDENLYNDALDSPKEKKELWDEKLVLGGGWLYKHVSLSELTTERTVIQAYLDIVDEILFGGPDGSQAGTVNPTVASQLSSGASQYRRGWLRVKATSPTPSRIRRQRSSIGPQSQQQSPTESEAAGPSATSGSGPASRSSGIGLRRVSSTGLLNVLNEALVAEPEELGSPSAAMARSSSEGANGPLNDVGEGEEEDEEGEEFEDEELPDWARRDRFGNDVEARLHAILSAHLPPDLLNYLPSYTSPADRTTLLTRLSDGQLLCHAYNAIVRRSRKQWGFIGPASIHDIIGLEAKEKKADEGEEKRRVVGWTFRRMENLRLWAAALKLRYLVALAPPPQPTSSTPRPGFPPPQLPSHPTSPVKKGYPSILSRSEATPSGQPNFMVSRVLSSMGAPVLFDAKLIAKREDGWDKILETALERWVTTILRETRSRNSYLPM